MGRRTTLLKPYEPKPRYIPKLQKHEESIHRRVCSYLRLQYPRVIFCSDFTAGRIVLTPNQARQYSSLQSGRGFPDLFIYLPRKVDGKQHAGLALELKTEGTAIFLSRGAKKGQLVANTHIQEQYYMLQELQRVGYWADFAIGYDDAINKIDYYMGKPENIGLEF